MRHRQVRAIIDGTVYTPDEVIAPGVVLIEGSTIKAVGPASATPVPPEAELVEAGGMAVVPGFIDVHVHGLMGHDAMGADLAQVIRDLPAFGVTAFLGTTLTLPRDETFASLEAMVEVLGAPPPGARCLGIHLEGPFLSPTRPGMATSDWFEPLNWGSFRAFQQEAGGRIRMITFAPEVGEAMDCIPRLIEAGVVPVIGHSNATFEQVAEAVQLGLAHATHTFNAMRPLHHREPGVVGAVMYFDEIVAQLIADGVHVHPAVMAILLRVKGVKRVALVSDASPLAGLPDGEYEWEHKPVFVRGGSCRLADGTIAGAHALLDTGVRNLVNLVGLPLEQALVPATCVPADVLRLRKGRLAPGYDADVVLLDRALQAALTIVGGEEMFRREGM
ncbi:MAG: N-acetylglucosamine-6-phosphate deacetylase [Anaerolineae bacterium]|nr:N-acetylglucosamine-6-phosphate deacetylase [Anaerolineae bacterium]